MDDEEPDRDPLALQLQAARDEASGLRAENERLRALIGMADPFEVAEAAPAYTLFPLAGALPEVDDSSPLQAKINLMRTLFHGREDVYAVRWTSARTGKVGYSPAVAGGWGRSEKSSKDYLPLTDEVIEDHLLALQTVGVYPLQREDSCWFLASDFDGQGWAPDALAFVKVCGRHGIPACIERSRSGNGAHVWIFFSEPVEAAVARRLGTGLLRETMVERAEIDLESYDRLFPSQDFAPKKSFGNLIALPLQGESRKSGCTEFLNPASLESWPDQWAFLSSIRRLTRTDVHHLSSSVRQIEVGPRSAADAAGSAAGQPRPPAKIECVLGATLSIERSGLPPALLSAIKHLATLDNPEFYKKQKLRLSTYQTPRFIRCYEEDLTHIHLPRGVFDELGQVVARFGSKLSIADVRRVPPHAELRFKGALTALQGRAVSEIAVHDQGVLVAPAGTGKTVMGCALIAERNLPTLVLVHREPLLDQWRNQLAEGLGLPVEEIGFLGRGKDKRTGIVDVAMIQSLRTVADLDAFFSRYGFLVVDECHHVPAVSFEACVRRAPLRFILGLTATPYRKDGLEDLITMQCGPIRHEIERKPGDPGELELELRVRNTTLALDRSEEMSIQEIFRGLVDDKDRSRAVVEDVMQALSDRRNCLVLSQWKEHVETLVELLREQGVDPIVLEGGMGKRKREERHARIGEVSADEKLVIVSTGQYIGEGFDCPQLDTLFLAFPAAFKGKLVQYTGRILRVHPGKQKAIVYDYVDAGVPVLKAMFARRLRAYRSLGFQMNPGIENPAGATKSDGRDPTLKIEFDGYWIHVSSGTPPPYEIKGKYLFFSKDKDQLLEIAQDEIVHHGFHRAKVNAELLGKNAEHVMCLYYRDDSRKDELAGRAKSEHQVKCRYWKSDVDTRGGRYSDEFLANLDPSTRDHFARARLSRPSISPDEGRRD